MKKLLLVFFIIVCTQIVQSQSNHPVYKDKNVSVESCVNDLLQRMTLKEKVLQLSQETAGGNNNINNVESELKEIPEGIGSLIYFKDDPLYRNQIQKHAIENTRLGIPIIFGYDVIHGYRTMFPVSIGQACSFNTDLVTKADSIAAREAKLSGINWTFSPMIDVARDARWGRVMEGYGEDVYTNARFAAAAVKGYQGNKLNDRYSIAACLKHYVAYGLSEGGRDYHYSDVSPQSLWETYLPPYHAGVNAGAATVMSSFNDISGVPASANYYTLTTILKNRWKFNGFIVSDWGSVEQLMPQGVAATRSEAGMKAINAGLDMDMTDHVFEENLEQLVKEKKVSMQRVDDAVKRILRVKFELGLFDNPYTEITDITQRYLQPEDKTIAEQLAEESIVLLKNDNNVLPLKSTVKSVALIGPLAKNADDLIGSWSAHGKSNESTNILDALQSEFSNTVKINYAQGCDFDGEDSSGFNDAINTAKNSDAVIICLGEKRSWTGENTSRSTIALPSIQQKLIAALQSTGKPIILVLSNGRPLDITAIEPMANAIVEIWQPGTAGGTPLARVLTGKVNPCGKLAITFPRSTGQVPVYYSMRQSARPTSGLYQDISTEPLYWFGYGLSYTTYKYGNIHLSDTIIHKSQKFIASIEVENTGNMNGKETMLWYISQPSASISRPMKELKYFEKKEVDAGKKIMYQFEINPTRDLSFPDANGKLHLEAGMFYVIAGNERVSFKLKD